MIAVGAFGSLALGTALACISERFPSATVRIETMGGLCLVAGLALIGANMPLFG